MSDRKRTTQPSLGSNELGTETSDTDLAGVSGVSDTQLHLAAKSGKKRKKDIRDDEKVVDNPNKEDNFSESDEMDK